MGEEVRHVKCGCSESFTTILCCGDIAAYIASGNWIRWNNSGRNIGLVPTAGKYGSKNL